jgi:hypothetical protein
MSFAADPTSRVRRTNKKQGAKLPSASGLPEFASPNYGDVEKNLLKQTGAEIDGELNYLKRLNLRAKLRGKPESNLVPLPSDREVQIGQWMAKLNALNASKNPMDRSSLEVLYARMNSRSLFNIASELSDLTLQKQSIAEIESLVASGPTGMMTSVLNAGIAKVDERAPYART